MAWMLTIAADACLTGNERTKVFVELGCDEHHLAIERILQAIVTSRIALPVAISERLARWLDVYTGSPEEPRLRKMLDEIGAQQFRPVPDTVAGTKHIVCRAVSDKPAVVAAREDDTQQRGNLS
jgi:hypothetical protein